MAQRRKFSKEFKLEAVNLVIARGVSLAQASWAVPGFVDTDLSILC